MTKNIIIAALAFLNLLLLAALIYMGVTRSEPPTTPMETTVDLALPTPPKLSTRWAADLGPQEFTYTAPLRLVAADAPGIVNRALTITATFNTQDQDGVIIAQGDSKNGYALYVQDGKLFFAFRRNDVLTVVSGGKVSAGRLTITATLNKEGELALSRDGSAPASGLAAGMITVPPMESLDVGSDHTSAVGDYQTPNSFGGTIETVSLKTTP